MNTPNNSTRLQFRSLNENDWELISFLRSDAQVNAYVDRPTAETKEKALAFIHKITEGCSQGQFYYWAICKAESQEMIGTICLWNFSVDQSIAEIGYELHPKHQGKGYMSEALETVISFGFESLELQTIEAYTHKNNLGSSRLLKKHQFDVLANKKDPYQPDNIVYALSTPL